MHAILVTLYALVAVLLIAVVLIQQPKNAAGLFSGAGQSLLGTGGKTFMTKFTTALATLFMLLCIALAVLPRTQGTRSGVANVIQEQQKAAEEAAAQAAQAAVTGAPAASGSTGGVTGAVPASKPQAPAPAGGGTGK
jgi:preprotein translocase subunit SecG